MVHHESESDLMQSLFMGNTRSYVYGLYTKMIVKQKTSERFYQIKK